MDTKEVHRLLDEARKGGTDIHEHVPTLLGLAGSCSQIVEFGVNLGTSTLAFLAGGCDKLDSWDIVPSHMVPQIQHAAQGRWEFHHGDSKMAEIPQCDLLFIDSLHTGKQLAAELATHHHKVRDRIVMHDTETYGLVGEGNEAGLRQPLIDFLLTHCEEWRLESHYPNNNGLTILKRIG